MQPHQCPDCASTNVVISSAREQTVCRDCGLIFEPLAQTEPKKSNRKKKK